MTTPRTFGRAALIALAAAVLFLALAGAARAGTVRVSQCNAVDAGGLSPRGFQADAWHVDNGWATVHCGTGGGRIGVDTANHRLAQYESIDARFGLAGSMPHTSLGTLWVDWTAPAQAPSTNPAGIIIGGGGVRLLESAPGGGTAPGSADRLVMPAGSRQVQFAIWCSPLNGPGWCNWSDDMLDVRGLTVELEESREPSARAGGALTASGAHSGVEPLELTAADEDTGVRRVTAFLGSGKAGELVASCRDDRLPPCPQALHGTIDVDTRAAPDGPVRLRLVVIDAAGNARTVDAGVVNVANQPRSGGPPPPGPSDPPAPGVATPGPAAALPPAVFPPNPLAGRGHVPNGTHASSRARVTAWLELSRRGGVARRSAVTVGPGVRVRIRGRVRDRRGRPIGGATLAAYSREPGDARRPITGVRTRPNGRFTAFTRIGGSRTVRFAYYPYGDSTRGIRSPALRVTVRRPR